MLQGMPAFVTIPDPPPTCEDLHRNLFGTRSSPRSADLPPGTGMHVGGDCRLSLRRRFSHT
jgi:hypothetical protein